MVLYTARTINIYTDESKKEQCYSSLDKASRLIGLQGKREILEDSLLEKGIRRILLCFKSHSHAIEFLSSVNYWSCFYKRAAHVSAAVFHQQELIDIVEQHLGIRRIPNLTKEQSHLSMKSSIPEKKKQIVKRLFGNSGDSFDSKLKDSGLLRRLYKQEGDNFLKMEPIRFNRAND